MNVNSFIKQHIKWAILISVLLMFFYAILYKFDCYIVKTWVGKLCHLTDFAMSNSLCLRISISIAVPFLLFIRVHRIIKQGSSCAAIFIQSGICVIALILLNDKFWAYPDLFKFLNFKSYWIVVVWLFLFSSNGAYAFYYYSNFKKYRRIGEKSKGFTTDTFSQSNASITSFTKEIAKRVLNTDIGKESFSVGIAGKWGSGKTTYLNALKDALKNHVVYIDFQPWNSLSANKIVEDFFCLFKKEVAKSIDSSLESSITQYARQLLAADKKNQMSAFMSQLLVWQENNDISSSKQKIKDALVESDIKVVVSIDDIDRLDKEELFEVLRLIRNTANLPNLIYVVTYDKEYVINQLKGKGISNPELYLEKIINVEVMLPKVSRSELIDAFFSELKQMSDENTFAKIQEAVYSDSGNIKRITSVITNFREVKRFARQLAVHSSYAVLNLKDEISLEDLLWIELIRYADLNLYSRLSADPSLILCTASRSIGELKVQDSFIKNVNTENAGETTKEVLDIIKYLFSPHKRVQYELSIIHSNNYARYFYLGRENLKFYRHDYEELLAQKNAGVIGQKVKIYFESENPNQCYDIKSLLFLIRTDSYYDYSFEKFKNVVFLLFAVEKYDTDTNVRSLIYQILCDERLTEKESGKWLIWNLDYLKGKVNSKNGGWIIRIVRRIYDNCYGSSKAEMKNKSIETMEICFTKWAESSKPDAIDILNESSELYKVFKSVCQTWSEEDDSGFEVSHSMECLIESSIIKYFKQNPSAESKKFDDYFSSSLTDYEMMEGVQEYDKMEQSENRLELIFGGNVYLCNAYRKECFIKEN